VVTSPSREDSPPGLNLPRLTRWLDERHPGLRQGKLRASAIQGGRSNLTYQVTDDHNRWALRRPPLGHVLPTAHDMSREFTVITALHDSPVPVAAPIALCDDRDVLGEPFYLMSFVDGVVLDDPTLVGDPATAAHVTATLVDTLVALHSVDPDEVGLSNFGKAEGFLERQVRRWHKQFDSSVPDGNELERSVVQALTATLPRSSGAGIVHGDYRLTNVIFSPDFRQINAVVDWEMATLGDPLTDVGLLYVYHKLAAQRVSVMPNLPPEQGFLSPEGLVARYSSMTGVDSAQLDWYISLGYFKLGVIASGIHARFVQGKTVGGGFEIFAAMVEKTFAAAHSQLGGN
jgi:aminoglycoside phosphotransferase (APT) family kinase protein